MFTHSSVYGHLVCFNLAIMSHEHSCMFCVDMFSSILLWPKLCPPTNSGRIPNPNTPECDYIWIQGFQRDD